MFAPADKIKPTRIVAVPTEKMKVKPEEPALEQSPPLSLSQSRISNSVSEDVSREDSDDIQNTPPSTIDSVRVRDDEHLFDFLENDTPENSESPDSLSSQELIPKKKHHRSPPPPGQNSIEIHHDLSIYYFRRYGSAIEIHHDDSPDHFKRDDPHDHPVFFK